MLTAYPACFFKEANGYSVIFPDLEYLATCGETLDEALAMAIDCLAGFLYDIPVEEYPIPSAISDVDMIAVANELDENTNEVEGFVNLVMVDVKEYAKLHFEKAVKKTLTIPSWLNERAIAQGINFSQTLQDALKEKLHI